MGLAPVTDDELRLAAGAVQRGNRESCRVRGDGETIVVGDHMQAKVHTRGGAGRGEDLALVYVERVGIELDRRIDRGKQVGGQPVGGRPLAVQDPGRGQGEGAAADRGDATSIAVRGLQRGDHVVADCGGGVVAARHDDSVGVGELVQSEIRGDPDRSGGNDGNTPAHPNPVARFPVGQPDPAEHLDPDGEVERDGIRLGQDGDAVHGLAIYRRSVSIWPLVSSSPARNHGGVHAQIVLYDGFDPLDVIGPFEVLAAGSDSAGGELTVTLVSAEGARGVRSGTRGLTLTAMAALDPSLPGCVIVPGASGPIAGDPDDGVDTIPVLLARAAHTELTPLLRRAFDNPDMTVAGVCGGSLVMAMAGLIEGRHAVTHHMGMDLLEAAGVAPVPARVVDDGNLVTAGGVTSGLDLALYLLDRWYGPQISHAVEQLFDYERRGTVWRAAGREPVEL